MRLLRDIDVIETVDRHTRKDGTLDEDISVILEEIKTAFDKEKIIEKLRKWENESVDNREWNHDDALIDLCEIHEHHGSRQAYKHAIEIVEKGESE